MQGIYYGGTVPHSAGMFPQHSEVEERHMVFFPKRPLLAGASRYPNSLPQDGCKAFAFWKRPLQRNTQFKIICFAEVDLLSNDNEQQVR